MNNKGIMLIGVIIIIVALSIVALGIVVFLSENLRLDVARINQSRALYAAQAGIMKAIVVYRNNGSLSTETDTQLAGNAYYSFGGSGMFFIADCSNPTIIADRKIKNISMTNINSSADLTITHMEVSWTPDGGESLTSIDLGRGVAEWTGTASSGTNIDMTDYTIGAGVTENDVWLDWAVGNDITAMTISAIITFSDSSTAEIILLNEGHGSSNAMIITSTGKVVETDVWRRTLKVNYDIGASEIISWEESQAIYRIMRRVFNKQGFTLIELIITIVVVGLVLIPLGLMCVEYMISIVYSRDLSVAEGLAKIEMAKINNLAYNDTSLANGYDTTTSGYEGYHLDLNRKVDYVAGMDNNLKKVEVAVYESGTTTQLVKLVSYIADVAYGTGSGGGDISGGEASSLVVSGGSISGNFLQNVTLENTGASDITISGVIISYTGLPGTNFKKITMDGTERWRGTKNSPATVTFDTNFTLTASTTYTNTGLFEFSKNLTSVTSLVFIMSDTSETSSYSW